jgi:predicted Zn-dependent protease
MKAEFFSVIARLKIIFRGIFMSEQVLRSVFNDVKNGADFVSIRYHVDEEETLNVVKDVFRPPHFSQSVGAMITVAHKGGLGYYATSDISKQGLTKGFEHAKALAETNSGRMVFDLRKISWKAHQGNYKSKVKIPWDSVSKADKIARLMDAAKSLKVHGDIVHWDADFTRSISRRLFLSSVGSEVYQEMDSFFPGLSAVAYRDGESFTRSYGAGRSCFQGGLEILDQIAYDQLGPDLAKEALELLEAPDCPTGVMDLLLAPDQMVLQIHESIGHPLELDRILGDERNYAGRSFVTLDMFGKYRYGSDLLNITFDPTIEGEAASYGYDDDGTKATKEYLIKDGILVRPLGGELSQARSEIEGVACSRACDWNRPSIDRMANLNLEPGKSKFEDMVAAVEKGVYMQANCSWSIDDSRNKFQFGCEVGTLIENGKLTKKVRRPNYRGISAEFWRNLKMVGAQSTFQVMGSPNCGKGEPNQVIAVGHATPACLFTGVEVFGGGA